MSVAVGGHLGRDLITGGISRWGADGGFGVDSGLGFVPRHVAEVPIADMAPDQSFRIMRYPDRGELERLIAKLKKAIVQYRHGSDGGVLRVGST